MKELAEFCVSDYSVFSSSKVHPYKFPIHVERDLSVESGMPNDSFELVKTNEPISICVEQSKRDEVKSICDA